MNAQLFEVHLNSPTDLRQAEARLRQAVRLAGHDVWLAEWEDRSFLAVRMKSRSPEQEIQGLMRWADLWGYFIPLRP